MPWIITVFAVAELQDVDWHAVTSTNLLAVGYSDAGNLWVRFASGAYCYHDVPHEVYESLMAAPSKGTFLDREVKKKGYRFTGPL